MLLLMMGKLKEGWRKNTVQKKVGVLFQLYSHFLGLSLHTQGREFSCQLGSIYNL